MKKVICFVLASAGALLVLTAQQRPIQIEVSKDGGMPVIAIPDFRGSGDAQKFMAAFNETLYADVNSSGLFKIVSKSFLPLFVPQQPSDFQQPPPPPADNPRGRSTQITQPTNGGGHWMQDWANPPAQARYMASGYTAVQNGVFVLQGWLYDLSKGNPTNGQLIGNRYLGSVDEAGARKVAHEFAADIVGLFGGKSLFGTHIFFSSNRTGHKEIWMMDPDGKNQRQITRFNSISTYPNVSPDGSKIAFTSWRPGQPAIFIFSVDPVRDLRYYNQTASVNQAGSFTPDGKQIVYASSAGNGVCCRIFIANLDGTGFRPISSSSAIEVEPKVNPKTGTDIVFTSGRSGPQQIYRMNMDGADVERLTAGTGEASNPSWNPDGQHIAFAWTQGYATGAFNIFTMSVANRDYVQLTHGDGKNENPSWAPDGAHIVFAKTRGRSSQIWSMLANGTQLQQLTTVGDNERPVWGK
ncbi:MAG: domain protein beta Propeller [Candidatus Solibacter sp.]|nr:domain protein beta Propeller [Candidatus Solibacter sp.]